jgi:hypothetical protein
MLSEHQIWDFLTYTMLQYVKWNMLNTQVFSVTQSRSVISQKTCIFSSTAIRILNLKTQII